MYKQEDVRALIKTVLKLGKAGAVSVFSPVRHIRGVMYKVVIPYISSFIWHADPW